VSLNPDHVRRIYRVGSAGAATPPGRRRSETFYSRWKTRAYGRSPPPPGTGGPGPADPGQRGRALYNSHCPPGNPNAGRTSHMPSTLYNVPPQVCGQSVPGGGSAIVTSRKYVWVEAGTRRVPQRPAPFPNKIVNAPKFHRPSANVRTDVEVVSGKNPISRRTGSDH